MSNELNLPSPVYFDLELTKAIQGTPVVPNAKCKFCVQWNSATAEGLAYLMEMDGTPLDIKLYPLGLAGILAFASDIDPTTYTINGNPVVIKRVVLEVDNNISNGSSAITFNVNGSVIQGSANWDVTNAHV